MLEWEEADRSSFYDSDRFEDDSECSYLSEPESLCNNWRGWKRPPNVAVATAGKHSSFFPRCKEQQDDSIKSLTELCARTVAAHIPFEVVEQMMPVVPEQIQLWIAYWSFPDLEEDIRLYSCLANGNSEEFIKGENLYKHDSIEELLQIGFHLSATVSMPTGSKLKYKVAVTFDRGRVSTCNCTCNSNASWCSHIVAVCLHRIHQPNKLKLRAPVSESLSRLQRDQLQKFAQYLISELPQQILPTAQRLIDEILSSQTSVINTVSGAPDPTAGASANEQTAWLLDENNLHGNIRKILVKFCVPSPMVYSDVNFLVSAAPPVATEWQSLLRPLRGREPEGMWNLLSIVREMFKRHDHNAIPLLEIITEECLLTEKILIWWVNTKFALHFSAYGLGGKGHINSNTQGSQFAGASLCDEMVVLWRLAALNPALAPSEREMLVNQFKKWHLKVLEKTGRPKDYGSVTNKNKDVKFADYDIFPGFKPAIEACLIDWDEYQLSGITYSLAASRYYCPVMCCKHDPSHESHSGPISAPVARFPPNFVLMKKNGGGTAVGGGASADKTGSSRKWKREAASRSSSVSSEGFCDNDVGGDSDSPEQPRAAADRLPLCANRTAQGGLESDRGASVRLPPIHRGWGPPPPEDDFRVYLYNPHLVYDFRSPEPCPLAGVVALDDSAKSSVYDEKLDQFSNLKKLEDSLDVMLALAEGLHAHGHAIEASKIAAKLAEELLANPPNLMIDIPMSTSKSRKKKQVNPASHQLTVVSSATLAKCAFLCSVLAENPDYSHLAFRVALFGLEMPRLPASTKPFEVKLANQESDLVTILKRLPLGKLELATVRCKAEQLRIGTHNSRGEALLPLMLAAYVFDALVISVSSSRTSNVVRPHNQPSDEKLGFEAAVSALGMKANVSEADHPLLCEGTRRQRGDLALTLLLHYKDNKDRLAVIMEKFLDKDVHQMYKVAHLSTYYATNTAPAHNAEVPEGASADGGHTRILSPPSNVGPHPHPGAQNCGGGNYVYPYISWAKRSANQNAHLTQAQAEAQVADNSPTNGVEQSISQLSISLGGARPKTTTPASKQQEGDENVAKEFAQKTELCADGNKNWDEFKQWEDTHNKHKKRRSQPYSIPTAEGYNSELSRPNGTWLKSTGPGSDSGSSGNSSDSLGSFSSIEKGAAESKPVESPPLDYAPSKISNMPLFHLFSAARPYVYSKNLKYKGKRAYPTIPNQPSEAGAYFMFELAKTVLSKAGGTSSTSLFKQPPANTQNHRGPHRALQMCAFQIGLYALGLSNCVSPNWLSRTYSSHVSWISNQALEIGSSALSFLINTWEGHLTPCEATSIADKASQGRDPFTVKEAANLALSCLPHAHALNPNEIQRAIIQCKEQSSRMLEEACLAVEGAAKGGGVYPEVLFAVARNWFELYETKVQHQSRAIGPANRRLRGDLPPTENGHAVDSSPMVGGSSPAMVALNHGLPMSNRVSVVGAAGSSAVDGMSAVAMHNQLSVGMGVATVHPPSTMHNFAPTPPAQPVGYSIPGVHYPVGYNYFQGLPPNVSCVNPPLPFQMYIQPQIPFASAPGSLPQPLLAPPPIQHIPYFPPGSLASAQGINGNMALPTGLPHIGGHMPNNPSLPVSMPGQQPAVQQTPYHTPQVYPMPFGGFLGQPMPTSLPPPINHFVRPPPTLVQHQPPLVPPPANQPQQQVHNQVNATGSMLYLMNAYRVGMLAMETLARRVQDDRIQARFARNPPYGEDVKWLLNVAKKLGTNYLHQFCLCSVNSVISPFILYDLAVDVANYLMRNSPTMYHQHMRSPILHPLVQKCQQMFIQCTQVKIYYITPDQYEEFVSIVKTARKAFLLTPGGLVQFNELLQNLRRLKCCKKELWQQISNALQQQASV